MNNSPKVSVCIPAYNAQNYITKCIDSVISQTYQNIEVIVLDDASTDKTEGLIKKYNDKRIKYVLNEKNLGWRGNVRKGYLTATGDFITMLPVDDFLKPTFVESAVKIFCKDEMVGVWSCGNIMVDENGEKIGSQLRPKLGYIYSTEYFRYTYTMLNISPPSETMVRKKCIDLVNGAECYNGELKQFPEILLYLKIAELGYGAYHEEQKLTIRTSRHDSLTGMYGKKAFIRNDNIKILNEFYNHKLLDDVTRKAAVNNFIYILNNDLIFNLYKFKVKEAINFLEFDRSILATNSFQGEKIGYIYIIKNLIEVFMTKLKKHFKS